VADRQPLLEARLIGVPELSWGDRIVQPGARKAHALLCYLAAEPAGATRDELAELLWGPGKLGSVRQALYELRKLPGADVWLHEGDGRVRVRCRSDLAALLGDLEAAADTELPLADTLLLEGASPGGSTPYDEWLEVERARVDMLLLEAVEWRAVERERVGAFAEALALTERLLDRDPLNESATQSAMRLCYLLGDAEGAEAHFRACRRTLRDELGTEPLATTQALAAAIAAGEPLPAETSLEHLPETLERLMQALALGRGELDATLLAQALDRDPFDLAEELAELERRRLLDEQRLIPPHLLAETEAATPAPMRHLLHRRLAEALDRQGGDRRLRIHHWLGASERRRAAPLLLEEARWAVQRADEDALALAFRALWVAEREADRFAAAMLLEGVAERLGSFALQRVALDEGDALAWQLQDDERLCLVRLKRTRQLLRLGEVAEALETAQEALEIAERIGDPTQISRAVNGLGGCLYFAGRLDDAYDAFSRNGGAEDTTERYRALNNLGAIAGIRSDYDASYRHFGDALTLARREKNLDDIGATLNNLAGTAERMAAYDRAVKHLRESLRLTKRTADPVLEVRLLVNLAVVYGRQGALGPSWNTAEEALEVAATLEDARLIGYAVEHLGEIARLCGAYDEALEHFGLALERYEAAEDERKVLTMRCNLAVTRFTAKPTDPGDRVDAALEALDEAGLANLSLWFAAELALSAADPERIRRHLMRLDDAAAEGNPHLMLLTDMAELRLALLEADPGDRIAAPADLEACLERAQAVEAPHGYLLLARTAEGPRRAEIEARAKALLAEQALGLPATLRTLLLEAPSRWLTPIDDRP
jgi:DNA-binding SARP family transcriptional activator